MSEELIVDPENVVDSDILSPRERSCEFEKGLGNAEQIVNLTPFVRSHLKMNRFIFVTKPI